MPTITAIPETSRAGASNSELVKRCLDGSEQAWSDLIDKYKNLIFSVPIKYGFSRDEAADIFQAVCLELLSELSKLRKPEALPKWIMEVAAHKCFHRRREQNRLEPADSSDSDLDRHIDLSEDPSAEAILRQVEQEQNLRQAISELPPRCRELVRMLFFEEPAREYREIARELGISSGSIGFIRQRCLSKLRNRLSDLGF
jgi:RNA polymerase sigma factor (sigma-70 family)